MESRLIFLHLFVNLAKERRKKAGDASYWIQLPVRKVFGWQIRRTLPETRDEDFCP